MRMYGKIGTSEFCVVSDETCVLEGYVQINIPRPHSSAVLQEDLCWDCTHHESCVLNCWEIVKQKRKETWEGGVVYNGNVFQTRSVDTDNVRSLLAAFEEGALPTTVPYVTADNQVVQLSFQDFKNLHTLGVRLYLAADAVAQSLRAQLKESQDPMSVNINDGWPVVPYSG